MLQILQICRVRRLVFRKHRYFKPFSIFYFWPPPPEGPGKRPDCHFLQGTGGLGPIPARIRGAMCFYNFNFGPN